MSKCGLFGDKYRLSMLTINNEVVTLDFDTIDEDFDTIVLSNSSILYVYRIAPDHLNISPYYKVEYSESADKVEYFANDNELTNYLQSFFYSSGLHPITYTE